jgi:trehalose/maltose hydrolase-like predicted phosphorylase
MFLQSLVFGYGGLRFNDNGISMDPLLPPGVTAMKLRGLNYADAVRQQNSRFCGSSL